MTNMTPIPVLRVTPGTRQHGFSMVELMVAVVIGLFIILGLSQVFLSMYSNSNSQKGYAQYQDNIRTAMTMLTNNIQIAGYNANPIGSSGFSNATALPSPTTANADGSSYQAGVGIVGTGSNAGADTINVAFQTAGFTTDGIMNCQGGTSSLAPPKYMTYYNSFSVNSSGQLVCTVVAATITSSSVTYAAVTSAAVLATNVKSMNILYGVANNSLLTGSGLSTTGSWLNASQMSASYWANVRAVQISIVFNIPSTMIANTASSTTNSTTTTWTQTISLMHQS